MDKITDEEKKVMDELRERTINDLTPKLLEDDSLFYRFAKARDFNVVESEAMLRKHISWRKEFQIDTILTDYEPPEEPSCHHRSKSNNAFGRDLTTNEFTDKRNVERSS
ncbi:hypothetical protein AVEN_209225-1 [Araneus ventricosus]|uniref:CRAL/TRIO N-terminal domain-containing protein n=1 Tax=Araneus ventricosus TaxID=182803 RepID=A0A4Y2LZM2_ARAVE|nr:hypothetical protein AVEN_209225-1 [Araneus ventricosus]